MRGSILFFSTAVFLALATSSAGARERSGERPPAVVSSDLSAPWVMQLRPGAAGSRQPLIQNGARQASTGIATPVKRTAHREMDPIYLPQKVSYDGAEKPGTIIIDTRGNFLYLVQAGGTARRYGVGTGKPGFEWSGTHQITQKRKWPDWRPPSEMIARERKKGRILPVHMEGGPENPLGARAMYLGSTMYRIHGTNQPWSIGGAVSSGCIRMRNEDVVDLYERVGVGTKVVVM